MKDKEIEKYIESESLPCFIERYLGFKKECISANIINIQEIIKLFEVWVKSINS